MKTELRIVLNLKGPGHPSISPRGSISIISPVSIPAPVMMKISELIWTSRTHERIEMARAMKEAEIEYSAHLNGFDLATNNHHCAVPGHMTATRKQTRWSNAAKATNKVMVHIGLLLS